MHWWLIAIVVWAVALPVLTVACAALCRAGTVEDEVWLCRAAVASEETDPETGMQALALVS